MCALILAAFFLSPADSGGLRPVLLTGDMRADWQANAETATCCLVNEMPSENIRASWKKLGVTLLKRLVWDPEESAEHVRRRVGFLAVWEGADGVWLADEEKFSPAWKQAIDEARLDVEVALYGQTLAAEAQKLRTKDHKVWIEGRRAAWFFRHVDVETENLDTLRLEFASCARRLEQLLGVPARKLPFVVSKPIVPNRPVFKPLADRSPQPVPIVLDARDVALSEGFSFSSTPDGFSFTIASKAGEKDVWPGGRGSLRLYLPDGKGSWLPYEFALDLTPVDGARAPTDAYGLWTLRERWGKGELSAHRDRTWRLRPVLRGSYGRDYPCLEPEFAFGWNASGGWHLTLTFSWFPLYGRWPSVKNGASERWYVALDALPGVPAAACRLDWAKGNAANFAKYAKCLRNAEMSSCYEAQKERACNLYGLWRDERFYGFAETKEPTYHRYDTASGKVFWDRVLQPMLDADADLAALVNPELLADGNPTTAKIDRLPADAKMRAWKTLGRLLDLSERISLARRDYILLRLSGKLPPEPSAKRGPEGAAALTAPDADADDNALNLDDKEL